MSTQLFLVEDPAQGPTVANAPYRGTNDTRLDGAASGWGVNGVRTTRGSNATNFAQDSVTGPTSGLEFGRATGPDAAIEWITQPLVAAVTISGTITFNFWMSESGMTINAGAQCVIERLDNTCAIVSTIVNSEKGVELPTTRAAQNWTATPTSTNLAAGDRIRIRVAYNDAGGTMAAGTSALVFSGNGPTVGADGDSYVTFTETFTLLGTDPTGTTLYLTDTASSVDPGAATEKEAWTSRGSGSTNSVTNPATGFTAPIQLTATAGGTAIEWYSRQLTAFTLSGLVKFNVRAKDAGSGTTHAVLRVEVAVVASDGTSPTVYGAAGGDKVIDNPADAAWAVYVAGPDTSVTDGQRLRFRLYIDDEAFAMATGSTITMTYSGTSAAAAGDTYAILTQTVTEFIAAAAFVPYVNQMPTLIAQ